ncbi:glycoside hydrolase family 73 protein [Ligilactobacillus pobuzihii]|uniref:Muramidase n=1 Tax=Ligilactobacillus pobuzihii TaxID=449659 RepID=A0A0R2L8R2_9LACO|nr:glycoside hydrolase family 73 protein [Ligilactobacillus pobuzihii]KRK10177.1 Muramidase [Ligilactobacillus pobuzihii E100301 = KCTC 13174]KRN98200.1 Muramidase [Ligilactobacillus pobuzihii]GEN48289.1 muramidase [Ligilactobacillus pobuzihii]
MPQKKKQSTRKTTKKPRQTKKRRPSSKRNSKKVTFRWPDLILVVLLVTLVSIQTIKWFDKHDETPKVEQTAGEKSKQEFIKELVPSAQKQQRQHHVFTSITLAQASLESDWGTSELSAKYHNLFGVKSSDPNSPLLTTKEYVNGQWITVKDRFAAYDNYDQSIAAHAQLFVNGTGWDSKHYQGVINAKNYQEAAKALQSNGYATDPDYAQKLIDLIQEYHLDQYDL